MSLKYEPSSEPLHICTRTSCILSWLDIVARSGVLPTALEATQGQMEVFFSQLPYKFHLEEVASVGD